MDEATMEASQDMREKPSKALQRNPTITTKRRKELLQLAGEAAALMDAKGIKEHERCVFRRMVELMVGGDA